MIKGILLQLPGIGMNYRRQTRSFFRHLLVVKEE